MAASRLSGADSLNQRNHDDEDPGSGHGSNHEGSPGACNRDSTVHQGAGSAGQRQGLPKDDLSHGDKNDSLENGETSLRNLVEGVRVLCTPDSQVAARSVSAANSQLGKTSEASSHPGSIAAVFSQRHGQSPQVCQGQQFQKTPSAKDDPNETNLMSSRKTGDSPMTPHATEPNVNQEPPSTQKGGESTRANVHVISPSKEESIDDSKVSISDRK